MENLNVAPDPTGADLLNQVPRAEPAHETERLTESSGVEQSAGIAEEPTPGDAPVTDNEDEGEPPSWVVNRLKKYFVSRDEHETLLQKLHTHGIRLGSDEQQPEEAQPIDSSAD